MDFGKSRFCDVYNLPYLTLELLHFTNGQIKETSMISLFYTIHRFIDILVMKINRYVKIYSSAFIYWLFHYKQSIELSLELFLEFY